jgi:hypothetical protein
MILALAKGVKEGKSHKKCAPKLPKAPKYNAVKKTKEACVKVEMNPKLNEIKNVKPCVE